MQSTHSLIRALGATPARSSRLLAQPGHELPTVVRVAAARAGMPFEGLTESESNPDDAGRDAKVFRITKDLPHPYFVPGADPGEGFHPTNYQLFSTDLPQQGQAPDNKGFLMAILSHSSARASMSSTRSMAAKHTGLANVPRNLVHEQLVGSAPECGPHRDDGHTRSQTLRRSNGTVALA